MNVEVSSTTDSAEQVLAATGGAKAEEKVETKKSAPAFSKQAETSDDSEPSKVTPQDSLEASADEDGADEDDSQPNESKAPKKKGGIQKRIDKLSKRASEKEREAEYWKAEALKYQQTKEAPKVEEPKKADADAKPKLEDFDSHADYLEALTDYKVEQRERAREAKSKEQSLKSDFEKQVQAHIERTNVFSKEHPDFNDLMEEVDDVPLSITVKEVFLASEVGPALMYELAKNKSELQRICGLPALSAARELGKIEARLVKSETTETETKPQTSKAPPPLSPVGTKTSGTTKSLDDLPYEEFRKVRMEQLRR